MIFFSGNGFARLRLDASATERDVKRAYARELKLIDPATQPQAFADLRQDYENALAHVRFTAEFAASAQDFGQTGEEGAPGQDADKDEKAADMRRDAEEEPRPAQAPEPEPLVAQGQAPAPGPAPQELPRHLPFDSFAETLTFSPSDLPAAQAALRRWLAQDELMLMAAREAFEFELMEALGSRRFGQRTAVLFLAASQAFYWDSGRHSQLERMGHVGSYISSLLYEMAVLDAPSQWRWLALTETPDPKMALTLLNDAERMESLSPALARLFFADGHIEAWREARDHAPLLQRGRNHAATVWKTGVALRNMLFLLALPLITIGLMVAALSVAQKKEATRASALCDGYFASAMARNWKDMPLADITQLENCARGVPPLLCSDRTAMQDVLGIAKSVQGSRYYTYDVNGMQVNLSDGRRFGGAPFTGCSSVMSFAASASWLNQGDEKAAKQLVADVAKCSAVDSNRMESPALLTLLAQTDAWPAPVTGRPGKPIALSSLITAPNAAPLATSPNTAPAAPYKPWPACATKMTDDLKLRMGEKEGIAASIRANHGGELALRKILAGATGLSDAELAAAAAAAVAATAGR